MGGGWEDNRWMRTVPSAKEHEGGRETDGRELWNFSAHSFGIASHNSNMSPCDPSRCRDFPPRDPGDGYFSNRHQWGHSPPPSTPLCLIMRMDPDTAMKALGVILALAGKSVANWGETLDPASPSRTAVTFWHGSNCGVTCMWCQFKSLRGMSDRWHPIRTLGQKPPKDCCSYQRREVVMTVGWGK